METLTRIFLGLAAALPVLSSCQGMFADRQGTIRISFLDERTVQTRASDRIPPTDDFILTVTSSGGDTVYEGRFGDSPQADCSPHATIPPATSIPKSEHAIFFIIDQIYR